MYCKWHMQICISDNSKIMQKAEKTEIDMSVKKKKEVEMHISNTFYTLENNFLFLLFILPFFPSISHVLMYHTTPERKSDRKWYWRWS